MQISAHTLSTVDNFFVAHAHLESIYNPVASFSYLAVRTGDHFTLSLGRLFLTSQQSRISRSYFKTENICAGHFLLNDIKKTPMEFVENLLQGSIATPYEQLAFPPAENNGGYSAHNMPFQHAALQSGEKIALLTITGMARWEHVQQPQFDWEVKAASTPFDSVLELMSIYGLASQNNSNVSVELLAYNVAAVNFSSKIEGNAARLGIILARGLLRENACLGFRVLSQGVVSNRGQLQGSQMTWTTEGTLDYGSASIDIPSGAVLHCIATYNGVAQHQGWLSDPSLVQNPYRAVYEAFDDRLEILSDFLAKSQSKGRDARDLESAVSWLFWMLGFSAAHLGGTSKTQDAPDLVLTTPKGNFAVVECTTGLLKADHKLALLVERTEALKKRLQASGNRHLNILPIIITSKPLDEVRADIEQAEKLGVVVLTKESLEESIHQSLTLPQADILYEKFQQDAINGIIKHQSGNGGIPQGIINEGTF